MTLQAGTRLGPYEIESPIGAGGMGEVYRAKDTRLDRIVAVKVLPLHMAGSPELRQRFEREARAISQLSHPNICSLYDVGSEGETEYLVMEYLDGETLADRLTKGPLPFEQVLRFGIQIADGLDRAHRNGIIHRDLKPGNVMLTTSGVKLLDFGLAKHLTTAVENEIAQVSSLPTRLSSDRPLTEQGTIMGTFQYMSPEQLEGKEADARTDIFAFGCVLYEMATGQAAFKGKSRASTIAAILEREPAPISSIAPMTPPAFDRVVKTCLAKEPDDRFQTAHDIKLQLQWVAEGGSQVGLPAPVAARRRSRERLWIVAAAVFALLSAALAFAALRNRPEPARMVQSSLLPPEKVTFNLQSGPLALSPDGTRMAVVSANAEGKRQIWVRPLSGLSAQPLQGTDGATYPFWSPDSRYIAFFAAGKIRKIDASGGPPESICDAVNGRGGSWGQEGTIVFAPNFSGAIFRVSASGGTPEPVTKIDDAQKDMSHRFPSFLPDGRHFIYLARGPQGTSTSGSGSNTICVASTDDKQSKALLPSETQAQYAPPGYLVTWREGTLIAQPFDAGKLSLTGDSFPIAEGVQRLASVNFAFYSVSSNGFLAYQGGALGGQSQLGWYDRNGREIEKVGAPADASRPRLSHDMQRLAIDIRDPQSGNIDIWIYEFGRKTLTRFTFDPAADGNAQWSPDDRWIVFSSARKGSADVYRKASTGTGAEEVLLESDANKSPYSWSSDGKQILLDVRDPKRPRGTGAEFSVLSLGDRKVTSFLRSEFNMGEPVFSPDGRYVAYTSAESGRLEIFAQSFPGPGGKWQVSTEGGEDPLWGRDGKELFYVAPGNRLMSVPVKTGETFQAGNPQFLFEARFKGEFGQQYDVVPDGQRFLISADVAELGVSPITLVQNWLTGKKQ